MNFTRVLILFFGAITYVVASDCPESCPSQLITPTCGSDGKLYYDECDFKRLNCNNGVTMVKWSDCKAKCGGACTMEYNPRCGSDSKIYGNRCVLLSASCGKPNPIPEEPMEKCKKTPST